MCRLSGVNVLDGVNLQQDISGNEHMRSGHIMCRKKGDEEWEEEQTEWRDAVFCTRIKKM